MACFSAVIPAVGKYDVVLRRNLESLNGPISRFVSVGYFSGFGCGGYFGLQGINREFARFLARFGDFDTDYRPVIKDLEAISLLEINREFIRA